MEYCFQIMKRFSWIKLLPVLIHLKYWYYNTPSLEISCLANHLCQISLWLTETPIQHNMETIILFIGFPILPNPIWPHATGIVYTKPYAKPSHPNFLSSYMQIIKSYGSNMLSIKKLSL